MRELIFTFPLIEKLRRGLNGRTFSLNPRLPPPPEYIGIYQRFCLPACLPACLPFCLSVCLCLPVCLPASLTETLSNPATLSFLPTSNRELRTHLVRTQSLNVLPFKPGVGQYIAIHATLTARGFFHANFYPSCPFTCIFFQNLSRVFPVLAVVNTGSCVCQHNKIGHSTGCRFPC